jgi:hypothetical protein
MTHIIYLVWVLFICIFIMYMTKGELKSLIRTCICEVHLNIDEGAILNVQDIADKVVDKFKKFYINSESVLVSQNTFDREHKKESVLEHAEWINTNFFFKLKIASLDTNEKTTDIPIPIIFRDLGKGVHGAYRSDYTKKAPEGVIHVNIFVYLATNVSGSDKYKLIPPSKVDYDELSSTIEHELMHYEQHARSGKEGSVFFGKSSNDPEIKKMLVDKPNKPENLSDEKYAEYVNYYNLKIELNTHAKDTANKFANLFYNRFKKYDKSFTADQMKQNITSIFTNPQNDESKFALNLLFGLFDGYRYLTPKNRNKWWNYVYKSILGTKYKGVNEPLTNCPSCGSPINPGDVFCGNCGYRLVK